MPTITELLAQSTREAEKAAKLIGGSFKQGVGFTPGEAPQKEPVKIPDLPRPQTKPLNKIDPNTIAQNFGISTSIPSVNEEDIKRKTKEEGELAKGVLSSKYGRRIADVEGLRAEEKRALEGNLGTRRRFSTSAQAFIQFQDESRKKEIAELESQRDEALASMDLDMLSLIDKRINDARTRQKEDFDTMFKVLEYAEKLEESEAKKNAPTIQASRESAISGLLNQGVEDPTEIAELLNFNEDGEQVGDFSLGEINKVIESAKKTNTEIEKMVVDLGKTGAPNEVIDLVSNSRSVAEAVKNAGEYLVTGSGMVSEYLYYKRQAESAGQIPKSFEDYQNEDANRKKSIAAAGVTAGTDLNSKELAVFNRIVEEFNASEAIKALDRASRLNDILTEIEEDPNNASQQLNLIYAYIKGLDTDSAVREGEIDLVRSINSYLGKFQLAFERINSGKPVTGDVAKQIASSARTLIESISQTANRKKAVFDAQAKQNGTNVYSAWKSFSDAASTSYADLASTMVVTEEEAKGKVIQYGSDNPDTQAWIKQLITENAEGLDRPYTYEEVLQILGI